MDAAVFGIRFYDVYTFLGTLFMNALKMLIVPLIMSSIITGMAGISDSDAMGRLGGKTLLYYMTTSLLAICVGLLLVNLVSPGIVDGAPAREVVATPGTNWNVGRCSSSRATCRNWRSKSVPG